MAFRIGQKVVCINAGDPYGPNAIVRSPINGNIYRLDGDMGDLTKGEVYTIAAFGLCPATGKTTVCLVELPSRGPGDPGYDIARFRPLVEKKTDISTLIALLNPVNHKHLEGV